MRETLFNWLGQRLDGLACLDLFAGSGVLGFEAASRGARRVVMVENDRAAFRALEEAHQTIGFAPVELVFGVPNHFGKDSDTVLREFADILSHGMLREGSRH